MLSDIAIGALPVYLVSEDALFENQKRQTKNRPGEKSYRKDHRTNKRLIYYFRAFTRNLFEFKWRKYLTNYIKIIGNEEFSTGLFSS